MYMYYIIVYCIIIKRVIELWCILCNYLIMILVLVFGYLGLKIVFRIKKVLKDMMLIKVI